MSTTKSISLEVAAVAALSEKAERRRGYRRQMIGLIAGSYLLDAAILYAYYLAGTTTLSVPIGYALCGMTASAVFLVLSETGISERASDHYLTLWSIVPSVAIQFGFLALAPEVGFVFLTTLFIIFGFGSLKCRLAGSSRCLSASSTFVRPAIPDAASRCPMFDFTDPIKTLEPSVRGAPSTRAASVRH